MENSFFIHRKRLYEIFIYYFFLLKGVRRDLVSEPKKPDVYLPVTPVAFGSQLNDEIDEKTAVIETISASFNSSISKESALIDGLTLMNIKTNFNFGCLTYGNKKIESVRFVSRLMSHLILLCSTSVISDAELVRMRR